MGYGNGGHGQRESNDKPAMNFGIQSIDDGSVGRVIRSIAPVQNRSYIYIEIKNNLIKEERKALLNKFPSAMFKKVALVSVGEPSLEFRKKVQEINLQEKQEASDRDFRVKLEEEKKKRAREKHEREVERAKKRAEKEAKKAAARAERERKKQEKERKKQEEADRKAAEEAAAKAAADAAKATEEAAKAAAGEAATADGQAE